MLERWQAALATGQPYENELRLQRAGDGSYRWHLTRAVPMTDRNGAVVKWYGSNIDIHDQKRAEEAQRFLVDAGAALAASLDYRSTLAAVAKLAVPRIADWARVDVVDEGRLRTLAVEHVDAKKIELAFELARRYPENPDAEQGPPLVLRTGESELAPEITEEQLAELAQDDFHLGLVRELGVQSYMCVPLVAHGELLGVISLVAAESGRRYDEGDLALAEELARRAGTAVENAQLYREVEERAQAARVLETVGDGVFLVDTEGVIRLWNRAAETISGIRRGEIIGRRLEELLPGWERVSTRAETMPFERDGRERWVSISGVAFDVGVVYAFQDISDERALEQIRQDLVATVSHELRTPLAAIYGSAITLNRDDVEFHDELKTKLLNVIVEESSRLTTIVNDLLLASQLDAGRLDVYIESCDARALGEGVVAAARTHLPEGVRVELDPVADDVPPVAADESQLRQVLDNLLDNAIKYSPSGGDIRLGVERAGGAVRFSVADGGLGIPTSEQERIFEKFYRLDPDMTGGIGGTGLGLFIARELVRRVGGRIWVEPNGRQGSLFHVEIPAAAPARAKGRQKAGARP